MVGSFILGIDVGSTTVKTVALDPRGQFVAGRYVRAHGRPRQTLFAEAQALAAELGLALEELAARTSAVGFTGSGGRPVAELLGGLHVNELVAQTRAIGETHPQAHTVIEIGGQDSKFLAVEWDAGLGKMVLVDMAMNNLCAAGTGAFLDQQAERLGIAIEKEFAAIALQAENPARIAGRCTVFAKSDMIHLQQKGTPLPEILAGLSMALARNFRSVIGKGKTFRPPIVIQGGVAYNRAVVRAFEQVLRLQPGDLIIPERHELMPAIGAALVALDDTANGRIPEFRGFGALAAFLAAPENEQLHAAPLPTAGVAFAQRRPHMISLNGDVGVPVFLGIDTGSVTTKVVALDEKGNVLARRYLLTQGRPLEAVRRGLLEVGAELDGKIQVIGVGTTGSGRHLTADYVGGDIVRSEITAQARAAIAHDPQVDTIFEIGGQDSKYIRVESGAVVNFTMNSACAAGTGAFLQEQAGRLQVQIEEEFSRQAFCAQCPVALGERCTVFMESDLVHHQQQGAHVEELTAGLAYAIVENYLNRVVNNRTVGQRIFFQGGVAWNDSVVAAFQSRTGKTITVPPHHDVSGAIGAALLARDEVRDHQRNGNHSSNGAGTRFRGFDLRERQYEARSFICQACPNLCEINRVTIADEAPIFYGARCDMYEDQGRDNAKEHADIPDLFAERHTLLMGDYSAQVTGRANRPRIGMPRTLFFYDMFPYWRAFFAELGMDIVLSMPTSPATARRTRESAAVETCYPVKLVYGHVAELLEQELDLLFLPTIVDREDPGPGQQENASCPYIAASGCLVAAGITPREHGPKVVRSPLRLLHERFRQSDLARLAADLGTSAARARQADAAGVVAQAEFDTALRSRGRTVLDGLESGHPALVMVGRPYNTADAGVCQDLPYKLRKLGMLPIPLDMLPLHDVILPAEYRQMNWRCGQHILAGAQLIRQDPRLHAIYITSFGCGPDSFIISYFRRMMSGKPYLELEIDDHTADAGIITRCEAFVESLQVARQLI